MFTLRNIKAVQKILIDTCPLHGEPLILHKGELQTKQRINVFSLKGNTFKKAVKSSSEDIKLTSPYLAYLFKNIKRKFKQHVAEFFFSPRYFFVLVTASNLNN